MIWGLRFPDQSFGDHMPSRILSKPNRLLQEGYDLGGPPTPVIVV